MAPRSRSTWSTSRTRGSRRGRRGVAIAPHGSPAARPSRVAIAMERADRREPLGDRAARVPVGQLGEVGAEHGSSRRRPIGGAVVEPGEVRPDGRLVRAAGVGRRVLRLERADEPPERVLAAHRVRPAYAVRRRVDPRPLLRPDVDPPAPPEARVVRGRGAVPSGAPPAARPPRRPPPRAGFASAAGSGGPPGSRRPTRSPSGRGTVAPQVRHRPSSPRRATAPLPSSWASWIAPVGSWLVVKSHLERFAALVDDRELRNH